ncbi:MAG: DUF2796 domain-containing protein [Pseudomonadota bacterium]|nr:DUF2796 domain-containing protein [Pseudomonadota bacterium]
MKISAPLKGVAAALVLAGAGTALAAGVHQHGLAHAAVVVEGATLSVSFRAPLMDVLGTEQPPGDAASRARYRDRLERLTAPLPAPAAQCRISAETRTTVDTLFPTSHHDQDHGHEHQDVEAEWVFQCDTPSALTSVTLPFLDTFSGLSTEVVTLLPAGQGALRLAPGDTRIPLE